MSKTHDDGPGQSEIGLRERKKILALFGRIAGLIQQGRMELGSLRTQISFGSEDWASEAWLMWGKPGESGTPLLDDTEKHL